MLGGQYLDISGGLIAILEFYKSFVGSYGVSIFLLVLTIKLVLLPLTIISQRAMMKTQKIQPELKEINEKYKNNPEVRGQKMMELYAENNLSTFSPFLSCVSLLISWPVIIALFQLLQTYFNNFSAEGNPISFLWIADISTNHHIVLAVAVLLIQAASMYLTTKLTSTAQPSYMKYLTIFMVVFIGWLSYSYPASLGIYWFSFSLIGMLEQLLIRKVILRKHIVVVEDKKDTKKNKKQDVIIEHKDNKNKKKKK